MHSLAEDLTAPGPGFVPADRVARLGTETVFAVSAEAAALAAQGRTIYPFHLGDLNIPTAEPIVAAMIQGHPRRQDHVLRQRRHRAAARSPGRRRRPPRAASPTPPTTCRCSRAASR